MLKMTYPTIYFFLLKEKSIYWCKSVNLNEWSMIVSSGSEYDVIRFAIETQMNVDSAKTRYLLRFLR